MSRRHPKTRTRKKTAAPSRRPASLRRILLAAAAAAALALLAAAAAGLWRSRPSPIRREARLNVLLVTLDTLRADALGVYGQSRPTSPHVDRLAREGVRFTAAHAHNTVTLPSHANILSGLLPPVHGVRENSGFRFPADLDTLATLLHRQGYRTGAFVSSLTLDSRFGLGRGFDVYDDAFSRSTDPLGLDIPERAGTATVARALDWLSNAGAGPWLCWVHLYDPHAPYAPPAPWSESFRDAPYLGEVAATDAALDPLLTPILDRGREGRTLVVLTADHGEALGEHGERNHGLFAYEATLHVPLILYAPRLFPPRVVETPVRHVDLLPTVLDALDLPLPQNLAGRSLLPVATGHQVDPEPTYFEALSSMLTRRWAPLYGVVSGDYKYIDLPLPELYDLRHDPREQHNLVQERGATVAALRKELAVLRGPERPIAPRPEDAELRERLAALGYLGATAAPQKSEYGPEDDPKRLVHLDTMMSEALGLRRAGDLIGARELATRVVEERPDMTAALLQLALIDRDLGDLDGARRALEQAVASKPDDSKPAALLAGLMGETGLAERGLALLDPWLRKPEPPVEVLTTRGVLLARLGRNAKALGSFEQAHALDPADAVILVQIATVHLASGDHAAARAALEQALQVDSGLALAHHELGLLALGDGDRAEAERRFRTALEREPDMADALLNLGRVLLAEHRAEEARPIFERFLAATPPGLYRNETAAIREWLRGPMPSPAANQRLTRRLAPGA